MTKNIYQACTICGKAITVANYARHFKACSNPESYLNKRKDIPKADKNSLKCQFCSRQFKKAFGIRHHEIACEMNPDRVHKYNNVQYIHADHNLAEIQKWLNYIESKHVDMNIANLAKYGDQGYITAKGVHQIYGQLVRNPYLHNLIADRLINGCLQKSNSVHHIDKCRDNNDTSNLMIFKSKKDHNIFHLSPYAYIIYDTETNLFSSQVKYMEPDAELSKQRGI